CPVSGGNVRCARRWPVSGGDETSRLRRERGPGTKSLLHERSILKPMTAGGIGELSQVRARIEQGIAGRTLLAAFEDAVRDRGDAPALHWRTPEGWQQLTWRQYRETVRKVACGLRSLGVKPRTFAALLSRNRPEHLIADLGVLYARGVPVSLYNTLAPD